MGRLGIHSFVWTGGATQAGLEEAMEKSAACGYRLIEFAYLRPEKFDLDQPRQKGPGRSISRSPSPWDCLSMPTSRTRIRRW